MALVADFLTGIRNSVLALNGDELSNWLKVAPSLAGPIYHQLAQELKISFPATSHNNPLEKLLDRYLPEQDDVVEGRGSPWPGLNVFIQQYLEYWRDTDFENVVKMFHGLSDLLNSCANAFANPLYGIVLLETSVAMSESLCGLVMNLNRLPDIMSRLQLDIKAEEAAERKSIVEIAADIIQKMFTNCLSDRSSTRWQQPRGKKTAVYLFANTTLKLLFACNKSRLATQMLTNLAATGPLLSHYAASQRVRFLYYLGRFNFDHCHYLRAHMCFEAAYLQCPPQFPSHRRQLLTYWLPTNILLGRFPSQFLLSREESVGLGNIYLPICRALRSGNFVEFHHALRASQDYLWPRGLYLPMLELKSLVWRSLTRKTFLITWQGLSEQQRAKISVPFLDINDVVTTATYSQKLLEGYVPAAPKPHKRPTHINSIFMKAVTNSAAAADEIDSILVPPPGGPRRLRPTEGLIFGNKRPDIRSVEAIIGPLIYSGLLHGFVARLQHKFAIEGARRAAHPALAGWPVPYQATLDRFRKDYEEAKQAYRNREEENPGLMNEVPGWVTEAMQGR